MATVVLVRHGRSTANSAGVLAGRLPGTTLDEVGVEQARAAGARLVDVPLAGVLCSPSERCLETARAVLGGRHPEPATTVHPGLDECDYGTWQGGRIADLAKEPLWELVQRQPSAATFPGGESVRAMQQRAVEAVRAHDAAVEAEHGPGAVWLAVSHGDVIKSLLADALGLHLDQFQRLHVDPASVSVVRYTRERPYVLATNTHAGDLGWLAPSELAEAAGQAPGGGAGPGPVTDEALG